MSGSRFVIGLIVIFALALSLRLFDIAADPPKLFADGSQDLTTDGAYLTLAARNAAQNGTWELSEHEQWRAFKVSLISAAAYGMFVLAGVTRDSANLTGVIVHVAGLFIFVLALAKAMPRKAALITAFLLAIDFVLFVYSRVPFAENGLLFLASLTFLVYTLWFDTSWGKVLVGLLVALCALLGKSFGLLLIVGPLIVVMRSPGGRRTRDAGILLVPFAVLTFLFVAIIYRDEGLLSFLWEHSAGEHGFPHGLSSPLAYVENLISFARKGLHRYSPVVALATYLYLSFLLVVPRSKERLDRTATFMIAWLVASLVILSPFNYQPLRYMFILIIPMATLTGTTLSALTEMRIEWPRKIRWVRLLLLLLLNWYFAYYVAITLVTTPNKSEQYHRTVWYLLPAAALILFGQMLLLRRRTFTINARRASAICGAVLLIAVLTSARLFYDWGSTRTYGIAESCRDIEAVVGPDAVVSGQYGPVLVSDSRVRAFPLFITADLQEFGPTLAKYPITHLAIGKSEWDQLTTRYPRLKQASILTAYWLRDNVVYVVNVAQFFGNETAATHKLTRYETAIAYMMQNQYDSSLRALDLYLAANPNHKSSLMEEFSLLAKHGRLPDCGPLVKSLAELYPTDFRVDILAASYWKWYGAQSADTRYRELAEESLAKAIRYYAVNEANLRAFYENSSPDKFVTVARERAR